LDLSQSMEAAGGIGGLIVVLDGSASASSFAYDGNGNVSELVTASRGSVTAHYEYDAFGNTLFTTGTAAADNAFRFSTKYTDNESGLVYYGYRFFDATRGRWSNRDPIGEAGGANLYVLLQNYPLGAVDPVGLWKIGGVWSGEVGRYSAPVVAEGCDSMKKLAKMITGDAGDWRLLGEHSDSCSPGRQVDAGPLLAKLETKLRASVVAATRTFGPAFGDEVLGTDARSVATADLSDFFGGSAPSCDCLAAALLIQARALQSALKPGEFDAIWYNVGQVKKKARRADHHSIRTTWIGIRTAATRART
jgi:RHS repeat-associated protein